MSAPLTLRDATPADAPAIAEIYAWHVLNGTGSFEEVPPPAEEIAARMAGVLERGLPWLVAEDVLRRARDGDDPSSPHAEPVEARSVLGYAYAMPYRPRSGYRFTVEDAVYVAPHAQRRGAGRALLNALVERLQAQGYRTLVASIGDSGNKASIALHAACGFEHRGTLRNMGFKHGRWLDVVWMQRALEPQPG